MKYKCTREIQNLWMLILRYIQLQIMHYINNIVCYIYMYRWLKSRGPLKAELWILKIRFTFHIFNFFDYKFAYMFRYSFFSPSNFLKSLWTSQFPWGVQTSLNFLKIRKFHWKWKYQYGAKSNWKYSQKPKGKQSKRNPSVCVTLFLHNSCLCYHNLFLPTFQPPHISVVNCSTLKSLSNRCFSQEKTRMWKHRHSLSCW